MNDAAGPDACPWQPEVPVPIGALHPLGTWPPGPPTGWTGWGLLWRMSRDLIGAVSGWRKEHGDLVYLRIWPEHQVVVTAPALVRELLLTHHDALVRWERGVQVFRQVHGNSVLTAEGPAWQVKRQALQPAFWPKAVQAFVPNMTAATQQALQRWPVQDARWPIESALTSLAMDVILRMLFSSETGDEARGAEADVHVVAAAADREFYWPASWPDAMPWKRAKRQAKARLKGLIDRRLAGRLALATEARPDDLLSRLLQLHQNDPVAWPLQAVRDECMTAFLAGHETVAATLTWWAWCMAEQPALQAHAAHEVRQRLQGRPPTAADLPTLPLLKQTLQETLRLYPAVPALLTRRCTRAITLGSWQFPACTLFMVPVQLMHHDPRWFADPLAFRPERFAPDAEEPPRGSYLPLGAGPRVCLGQHLAMAEMTVVAAMLLQRYRLAAQPGQTAPPATLQVTMRPASPLHLQLLSAQTANTG